MDFGDLKGKNAFVTGVSGGIGNAIAVRLAQAGVNLWSHAGAYSKEFEEDMQAIAKKYDIKNTPVYFDLKNETQMTAEIKKIILQREPVHILVNNAAMNLRSAFFMSEIDSFKEVYQVNVFAQILLMQMIGKVMVRQRQGAIVNIGSISGQEHNAGTAAYGSSKAALLWLTKTVARELAPYGIRVNAVSPGMTDTAMSRGYEMEEELLRRTNLKRKARAEEIAAGVIFLASDEASYISGEILNINGGRL